MAYRITIDKTGGTGGTDAFFFKDGAFYADSSCTTHITTIDALPTKVGYTANGCWSAASGGVKYINAARQIRSPLASLSITSDITIFVQWSANFYTVTVDVNGGTGGTEEFYYRKDGGGFYSDKSFTTPLTSITKPQRECFRFNRGWSEPDGGKQWTGGSGTLLEELTETTLTGDVKMYIRWTRVSYRITVDRQGGSNGTGQFFRSVSGGLYADHDCQTPIYGITPPTKANNTFKSLRSTLPNGTIYSDGEGTFEDALSNLDMDDDLTVYVLWETNYVTILIDKQGGAGGTSALYAVRGVAGLYAEPECVTAATGVDEYRRTGYDYAGCWTQPGGSGTKYVSNNRNFINGFDGIVLNEDLRIYVAWTARTYILTFDYNGGSGSPATKNVTFGSAVGELPTPTPGAAGTFDGWRVNGTAVDRQTVWNVAANSTAVAAWRSNFGNLTDYFNLGGSVLVLVGSENGQGRVVRNLWNGASEAGERLPNPVCTYRIKAAGNVTVRLGRAFEPGYFITGCRYATGADREPTLVVSGTANEGADAINLYDVTIPVRPDHVAQDPFNAVSGGGELVEMETGATCDPVVPYENNRPCASDVVRGRLHVKGRTAAYMGENAPAMQNSFVDSGVPDTESDVDFTSYSFSAERSL